MLHALPGASAEVDIPLRIICFEDKRHLEAYGQRLGFWFEALDGIYLLVLIVAVLIDAGGLGGGEWHRRRRW